MSDFIITEHAIIPQKYVMGVTTIRTTPEYYDLEKTVPASEERYSIIGHSSSGEKIPLYVDLKHEEIPSKMKIVAAQISKKDTAISQGSKDTGIQSLYNSHGKTSNN